MWSAGGRCPAEGCNFAFRVESDDETELDVVGAAAVQAHSHHSHGDIPVTVGSFRVQPDETEEDEERPRLIN